MNPHNPIYIVSKGRWNSRTTIRSLDRLNVDYYVVVEEAEYENYLEYLDKSKLLILPQSYLDEYNTCDDFGNIRSVGPGAARNFCWEHSIDSGFDYHWVMDDNIEEFYRTNRNLIAPVRTGAIFKAVEDFVNRYENVAISGLNYNSFCKSTDKLPPYILNTRIYSCLLIKNNIDYRWRCRYNEDTDLSLRILKDGLCTIQFNAFLQGKVTTQRMSGGNTKEFYKKEGTLNKSQMLVDLHPDVSTLVWKFDRCHHHVDYKPFRVNKLIKKKGLIIPNKINNYNMKLVDIGKI